MVIPVEQGKGHKDRYVMLSPALLEHCAPIGRRSGHKPGCFPGAIPCIRSRRASSTALAMLRPSSPVSASGSLHTLRHSFTTHLLEQKVDIRVIQVLLGHKKLDTTALYSQVATRTIREVKSPLDQLARSRMEALAGLRAHRMLGREAQCHSVNAPVAGRPHDCLGLDLHLVVADQG